MRKILLLTILSLATVAFVFTRAASGGTSTVAYGVDSAQTADLYPAVQPNSPVVIAIHGGSWMGGQSSDMTTLCQSLVQNGFACMSVDYRLAPGWQWPTQLDDMRLALAYERAHLADLNGSDWVAWWGASAGAHMALMSGYEIGGNAIVSWSAPTNLSTNTNIPGAVRALLGCDPASCSDKADSASPALHVTATPTLIVHSVDDPIVSYSQAQEIQLINGQKLILDGSAHANAMFPQAFAPSLQWLKAQLPLPPPPPVPDPPVMPNWHRPIWWMEHK